jgi:hypothetical protein
VNGVGTCSDVSTLQDPTLLNTALLKLADVFQTSNNLSRYCVVQVLLKSAANIAEVLPVPSPHLYPLCQLVTSRLFSAPSLPQFILRGAERARVSYVGAERAGVPEAHSGRSEQL